MFTIHFGDREDVIYNTSVFFNNTYSRTWFEDPFAQRMVKSIDRSRVVHREVGVQEIEAE